MQEVCQNFFSAGVLASNIVKQDVDYGGHHHNVQGITIHSFDKLICLMRLVRHLTIFVFSNTGDSNPKNIQIE